jgi:hypothetical protein
MAWFHAINNDDVAAASNGSVPSQLQQIAWMNDPRSDLSTFPHLRREPISMSASVRCTFKE